MAKQTINIGSGELTGDGESLRSAFDKINDNFNELYLKDTSDFDGQFSSLTGTPTTLAGYGITDAYTQAQVDAAIATVTAGHFDGDYNSLTNLPTLFDGQYSSLTGTPTIPADVSDLTDTTNLLVHFDGDYNSLTNQPTIPADVSDLTDTTNLLVHFDGELNSLTNSPLTFTPEDIGGGTPSELSINAQVVDFGTGNTIDLQNNTVNFTGATITGTSFLTSYTETDPVVGAITGIVKADGAGNISAAVAGTDYLTSVAFADLTSTPTTLSGYGITDALALAGGSMTGNIDLGSNNITNGGTITARMVGWATDNVNVYFRFEKAAHPDVEPSYQTANIPLKRLSQSDSPVVTIDIPSQGDKTFGNFLMYIVEEGQRVLVESVVVTPKAE